MAVYNLPFFDEQKKQRSGEPTVYETVITMSGGVEVNRTGNLPADPIEGAELLITAAEDNPGIGQVSGLNGVLSDVTPLSAFSKDQAFRQVFSLAVKSGQPDGTYTFRTSVSAAEDI